MATEKPYYDKNFMEIGEGDLLKVYHFRTKGKIFFMYQIALLSDEGYWQAKDYNVSENKGHYNLSAISDKISRVIKECEILHKKDWQSEDRLRREARKRRKLINPNTSET